MRDRERNIKLLFSTIKASFRFFARRSRTLINYIQSWMRIAKVWKKCVFVQMC